MSNARSITDSQADWRGPEIAETIGHDRMLCDEAAKIADIRID